ncbi:MAG: LptA/OstA family protein [Vampirovibrionales bacterium]|nr:LptA/OstA family protein [Vampirovibrionales bacterium]
MPYAVNPSRHFHILLSVVTLLSFPLAAQAAIAQPVVEINADSQHYDHATGASRFSGHVTVSVGNMRVFGTEATVKPNANGESVATFPNRPSAKRFSPPKSLPGSVGSNLIAVNPANAIVKGASAPKGWLTDAIQADTLQFYLNSQLVKALGNTVTELNTIAATPMTIRADVQEFDNRTKTATATGSVSMHYKDFEAYSPRMVLNVSESGKPESVKFSEGVRLKDGNRGELTGQQITYLLGSGNLIAEKNVRSRVTPPNATPGKPPVIIESDYQHYDKVSNSVIASGHVRIVYEDYRVSAPKATFKIVNNTVDKINLIGRSSVTEGDRTVTADRITLSTSPKSFDAQGNVKTQFKSQPGGGFGPALQ